MFLINPLEYIAQLDIFIYLFGAFGFYGVMLCLKKLVVRRS